jgi:poly(A) polymerase
VPSPKLRPKERKIVLYQFGRETYRDNVRLAWARSRAGVRDAGWRKLLLFERRAELPEFPVSGADLIARGVAPGPAMGGMLRVLEDWWIAAGFPEDKEQVLRRLASMGPEA